jgi:hypothetical protein
VKKESLEKREARVLPSAKSGEFSSQNQTALPFLTDGPLLLIFLFVLEDRMDEVDALLRTTLLCIFCLRNLN